MSYQYYTLTFVRFWITRIYDKESKGVFIGGGGVGGNHYLFRKDSIHVFAWSKEKDKSIYLFLVQKPGVLIIKTPVSKL